MKLAGAAVGRFLAAPAADVVLLYGGDEGLVRARAEGLTRKVAGSLEDPFRVFELDQPGAGALAEAAAQVPLIGGRAVVRVRGVGEGFAPALEALLAEGPAALVVIEAPGLASRSRLVRVVEAAPRGAAIGCWPESLAERRETLRALLAERGLEPDTEVLDWLATAVGEDRGVMGQEVEKLALYAGGAGRLDFAAVRELVGGSAAVALDTLWEAIVRGDLAASERLAAQAIEEGLEPVAGARLLGGLFLRLHQVRHACDRGATAEDALRALRPPLFFRAVPAFRRALDSWPEARILAAVTRLHRLEKASKSTAIPSRAVFAATVRALARAAAPPARV